MTQHLSTLFAAFVELTKDPGTCRELSRQLLEALRTLPSPPGERFEQLFSGTPYREVVPTFSERVQNSLTSALSWGANVVAPRRLGILSFGFATSADFRTTLHSASGPLVRPTPPELRRTCRPTPIFLCFCYAGPHRDELRKSTGQPDVAQLLYVFARDTYL